MNRQAVNRKEEEVVRGKSKEGGGGNLGKEKAEEVA